MHPLFTNRDSTGSQQNENVRRSWPGAAARMLAWIAAGFVALILVISFGIFLVVRTGAFHNYVLRTVDRKASQTVGAPVRLRNFSIHLSTLSLDLYGLTVLGADPYSRPPLLHVSHIELGVLVVSLLHRKWYLDNVRVDHPVVRVSTDTHGVSNLPKPKSGGGSKTNVFDLGVRHALLDQGEVYFNDRKSDLEADLHDVDFRSSFDTSQQKYSGTLSYRDGHLQSGSLQPVSHNLEVQFDATPTAFHLTRAKLTSGRSQLTLRATVEDYDNPKIQAHYDALVDGGEVGHVLGNQSVPDGLVRATGSLQYQRRTGRSALDAVMTDGDLTSRKLDVRTPNGHAQIRDIAAHYSLANGNATVRGFRAQILGGELAGTFSMREIGGNSHSELHASLKGISLADLKALAPRSPASRNISLRGRLNADTNAAWGKNFDTLVAHTNASMNASMSRIGNPDILPINGVVHGTYTASGRRVSLVHSYLHLPQTTLAMNGTVSDRSSLALRFQSDDLRELETIADLFRSPAPGEPVQPLGLAGTGSFTGVVRGSITAPHLTGKLVASNIQVRGSAWRVLRTDVEVSPSLASLQNSVLEPVTRGRITFNASAKLKRWSFTSASPLQIELHASQLDVEDLERIAGSQFPVGGTLAANISVHGTERSLVGQGSIVLTQANVSDQKIGLASLTFTGTGDEVRGNLAVHVAAGTLQGVAAIRPKQQSYVAQLTAQGISLGRLQSLTARNMEAKGLLNLHASGQGTFQNPEFNATVQIPQLELQKQKLTAVALQVNVADHVANAVFSSHAVGTSIQARTKVNLTGDYFADAALDTQAIPLQPLLAIYAASEAADLTGETELHATLHGPLKNKKLLEVHLTIPVLRMAYANTIQLAAVSPLHVDYANGVIAVQRGAIRGTNTDLQLQASIPTVGNAPMSVLLLGTVNLQLAHLFNQDIRSSGELRFDINSYGARTDPNVQGQIEVVDANFAEADLPVGLQHGNGVLTLTKNRLNIKAFQATVGGGKVTAQGGVIYRPSMQFDLGVAAKDVRMLYPEGVREGLDANLRLSGTAKSALLGGQVRIDNLSFTPSFDLTSFMGQFSSGVAAPPAQGFSQNLRLNLAVSSSSDVNLVSRTLSVDGTANLQVRGTAAQPVILGRINLNDGDVIFNSDRFVLTGGTVEFVNPSETQPIVNLALTTNIQEYNIYLRFNGPVDHLRTNYASDPSLPTADIINLLAFGQTTEANAANPATPANQAAESLIASQVSSQVTSRVSKIAGISQLSINPVLAGGSTQGPPGANITVQQRVTGNLFVTFSTDVTTTQNQIIMGQYKLSPRVSLSATRDQNGGIAFDTTFNKDW